MNYRKVPKFRRYPSIRPGSGTAQDNNTYVKNTENEKAKSEFENIPMPNENENSTSTKSESVRNVKAMNLNNFIKNIHVDDLILLGLIFILIQERLDDESLIIVLIYLLIAGIN